MKESKRLLIVYPSMYYYPTFMESVDIKIPLLSLYSYIKPHFEAEMIDLEKEIGRPGNKITIKRFENKVEKLLSERDFEIIGISCWTSLSFLSTLAVARIAKQVNPNCTVVVGGYHPSALPADFIFENSPIDFVVRGEGEEVLLKICQKEIKKKEHTQVIEGTPVEIHQVSDYDWSIFKKRKDTIDDSFGWMVYIYLSRDCPFNCAFCMERAKKRGWRALSPDSAISFIDRLVEQFNPPAIAISDACFGMKRNWRREFLEKFKKRNYQKKFLIETHPNLIEKEDIDLLAGINIEMQLGLETGSPLMQRIMKKPGDPEKTLRHFVEISNYCNEKKVLHRGNLIMNHPGETRATVDQTIRFVKQLCERKENYLFWAVGPFGLFPGSEVHLNFNYYKEKYGTEVMYPEWWKKEKDPYSSASCVLPSRDFTWETVDYWRFKIGSIYDSFINTLSQKAFDHFVPNYMPAWMEQ
jgi:anaerobic magnesium-protoporphyrin IX monomethyl ester cyclase